MNRPRKGEDWRHLFRKYTAKAISWDEVHEKLPLGQMDMLQLRHIRNLPVVSLEDIDVDPDARYKWEKEPSPCAILGQSHEEAGSPVEFVGTLQDGRRFYVNTEGFPYCRYAIDITDYDAETRPELPESLVDRLLENGGPHSYSCTMLMLPDLEDDLARIAAEIDPQDLAGDGIETEAHVTVCYGTHTHDPEEIKAILQEVGIGQVHLSLGALSTFPPSDHSDGAAVLKFDVESEDLEKMNAAIRAKLKTTDSFPEYHPHITLAYVKPEAVEKYLGKTFPAVEIVANTFQFSAQDGTKTDFFIKHRKLAERLLEGIN